MSMPISRRGFARSAACASLGAVAAGCSRTNADLAQAPPGPAAANQPSTGRSFPGGFYWGVGTSSYQIEGAWNEDGKGRSIWDTYAHQPGHIRNNDTGDVANDHYHRYKEDVALMKDIGANSYRFSIAWPRIFPEGTGQANPRGLDFYSRLVDELKAAGIEPFATLYHWDLPQTLQDKYRGWQSKDTARAFADYAGFVADRLGDRVRHFFTINEFRSSVEGGYQGFDVQVGGGKTVHLGGAPGIRLSNGELNQVRHHAVLGHGLAVQATRARGRRDARVGFAENMLTAVPVIDHPEYVKAAQMATRELNADFTTVMLEGRYTDAYLKKNLRDAPAFTDDELKTIASPLDFVGINVYKPNIYVTPSDQPPGYASIPIRSPASTASPAATRRASPPRRRTSSRRRSAAWPRPASCGAARSRAPSRRRAIRSSRWMATTRRPEEEDSTGGQGVSEGPRYYDYGPGSDFGTLARLTRDGREIALFFYVGRHIYSLDGVRANHFLQHARVDLLFPVRGSLGIGTSAEFFHRRSFYQDAERTIATYHYPQLRAYLTWRNR